MEERPGRKIDVAFARRNVEVLGDSTTLRSEAKAPIRTPLTAQSSARRGWRGRFRAFARKHGWRAYALPLLAVITVIALLNVDGAAGELAPAIATSSMPPVANPNTALPADTAGANSSNEAVKSPALPAGGPFTQAGDGTFRIIPGTSNAVGRGQLFRYSIEIENGITGVNPAQFADLVQITLSDKRSWAGHGDVQLQRVDSGAVDFHVSLTSVMTVRQICGYAIAVETSCYQGAGNLTPVNRVVLDVARWERGSAAYLGDLTAYRIYMINHEDGHAVGHAHAHSCLPGGLAPAMMQQTIGLKSATTGQMCQANPWPYPPGVKGTPGAEGPDTDQNSEFGLTAGD